MIGRVNSFFFCFIFAGVWLLVQNPIFVRAENPSAFTPTHFMNVHFPEISPEEQKLLEETFQNLNGQTENLTEKFETLRSFLLLKPEYFTAKNHPFQNNFPQKQDSSNILWSSENPGQAFLKKTVSEEIRSFLWTLPTETKAAWQRFVDEYIGKILSSEFASHVVSSPARLRQLAGEAPFSSYEAEFLELLAWYEWNNGQIAQANIYWQMELQLRSNQKEEAWKTFFLSELPSLERLKNQLAYRQKTTKKPENPEINAEGKTGTNWRVTMTQIVSPTGETVFEDGLPEEQRGTLFPSRKRDLETENQETPELSVISPDGNFLAARLGTHISLWPEGEWETRPQSYLVVLDLARGGQLLWTAQPISLQTVFIGNPLIDAENLYIPILQNGSPAQIALEVYSLMDGSLKKRIPLFSTDVSNFQEYSTIFLPIRWTNEGNIQAGGIESGVQTITNQEKNEF